MKSISKPKVQLRYSELELVATASETKLVPGVQLEPNTHKSRPLSRSDYGEAKAGSDRSTKSNSQALSLGEDSRISSRQRIRSQMWRHLWDDVMETAEMQRQPVLSPKSRFHTEHDRIQDAISESDESVEKTATLYSEVFGFDGSLTQRFNELKSIAKVLTTTQWRKAQDWMAFSINHRMAERAIACQGPDVFWKPITPEIDDRFTAGFGTLLVCAFPFTCVFYFDEAFDAGHDAYVFSSIHAPWPGVSMSRADLEALLDENESTSIRVARVARRKLRALDRGTRKLLDATNTLDSKKSAIIIEVAKAADRKGKTKKVEGLFALDPSHIKTGEITINPDRRLAILRKFPDAECVLKYGFASSVYPWHRRCCGKSQWKPSTERVASHWTKTFHPLDLELANIIGQANDQAFNEITATFEGVNRQALQDLKAKEDILSTYFYTDVYLDGNHTHGTLYNVLKKNDPYLLQSIRKNKILGDKLRLGLSILRKIDRMSDRQLEWLVLWRDIVNTLHAREGIDTSSHKFQTQLNIWDPRSIFYISENAALNIDDVQTLLRENDARLPDSTMKRIEALIQAEDKWKRGTDENERKAKIPLSDATITSNSANLFDSNESTSQIKSVEQRISQSSGDADEKVDVSPNQSEDDTFRALQSNSLCDGPGGLVSHFTPDPDFFVESSVHFLNFAQFVNQLSELDWWKPEQGEQDPILPSTFESIIFTPRWRRLVELSRIGESLSG